MSRSPVLALGVYAVGVVLLGCLMAPPFLWAGHALGEALGIKALTKFPLHRFFDRAILVAAVGLAWPLWRYLDMRRMEDFGLARNRERWRHLGWGLFLGIAGLWIVAQLMMEAGRAKYIPHWKYERVLGAVATAAVVAVLEETIFRGFLFGVLRKRLRPAMAIFSLSFIFAFLHFWKPPWRYRFPEPIGWTSAFEMLPDLGWQFGSPRLMVGGFLTLFLVGATLAYAAYKTRSLYLGIGLHAGWVFALRSFDAVTKFTGQRSYWFGKTPLVGLAPVLLVLCTFAVVALLLWHWGKRRPDPGVPLAVVAENPT